MRGVLFLQKERVVKLPLLVIVTGRVQVGYFQPLANPYPHHRLAVTREKTRSQRLNSNSLTRNSFHLFFFHHLSHNHFVSHASQMCHLPYQLPLLWQHHNTTTVTMAMTTTTTPTTTVAMMKRITVGIRVMWAGQGLRASDADVSLLLVSPQVRCFSFFFPYYICTNDYIQIPKPRMSPLKNRTRTKGDTRAGARDAYVSRAQVCYF